MSNTCISVVIPCFNAAKWLGEAIESALTQDYGDVEVVVINDGSTDGSVSIAQKFGARVTCISQANRGASAARNRGLCRASGKMVQFLDADDLLHKNRFSSMLRAWEREPQANFVTASYRKIGKGELSAAEFARGRVALADPEICTDALSVNYLPAMTLFKKEFLESLGPWNETLTRWVDLEYHARIAARGGVFAWLPVELYGYRQHDGPRISNHDRANTDLDEGLRSLVAAEAHFSGGALLPPGRTSYFFPFYVQLARGYASAGNKDKFLSLLRAASARTGREGFKYKAAGAESFARLFGAHMTARMLNRFLPPS